jgi:hypothetical protein
VNTNQVCCYNMFCESVVLIPLLFSTSITQLCDVYFCINLSDVTVKYFYSVLQKQVANVY